MLRAIGLRATSTFDVPSAIEDAAELQEGTLQFRLTGPRSSVSSAGSSPVIRWIGRALLVNALAPERELHDLVAVLSGARRRRR
eukprot:3244451-Pyramimonas_sp.AAC.1